MSSSVVRRLLVTAVGAAATVVLAACASVTTPAAPTQPPPTSVAVAPTAVSAAQSVPAASTPVAFPLTVNVTITDFSITPSGVAGPTGRPLLLVIRNKGLKSHGYRIDGFEPKDGVWFETDPELESHVAMGHETADVVQVTILDEHAEHHAGGELFRRLSNVNAIVTAGETKMVMFIPATAGTYAITDPSNPDLSGSLIVF